MEGLRVLYLVGFVLTSTACFLSLRPIARVTTPAVRRGLVWLLALSGLWALSHVGRLLPVAPEVQTAAYTLGLVVGLGTVGAWLYFCSAYTGHDYHRRQTVRRVAIVTYLGIVGLKLTNPLHNQYFTTSLATQPFSHVVVDLATVHWVVTGLSYALSAIGFYMLYEMLSESSTDTTALGGLVATTALPVAFYLLSFGSGPLLTLHYEPVGIAVFAVGVLYVVDEEFVAVPRFWRTRVVDTIDEAVVLLDGDDEVREANAAAVEMLPAFDDAEGRPLDDVAPDLATVCDDETDVFAVNDDGVTRYYLLDTTSLRNGRPEVGRALVCTDITQVERQRRLLERQNEQFDDLADAITHELRNTLTVAEGYLEVISDRVADHDPRRRRSNPNLERDLGAYDEVERSLDRMNRIVGNLSTLARIGRAVEAPDACDLRSAVGAAYDEVGPDDLALDVEANATVVASRPRLVEFFRSAVRFADLWEASKIWVRFDEDRLVVTTDGRSLSVADVEGAFAYGEAVPSAETGMTFPTMLTIARAHGWSIDVDREYRDGVRIVADNVESTDEPQSGTVTCGSNGTTTSNG